MIGDPRIGIKDLAGLCRRLAISLSAGVDVRTVWTREATQARGAAKQVYGSIRDAVARGSSVCDALDRTDGYFPVFFRELARVGEETGQLPEVFRRLAEHYEHQLHMRRTLLRAISWPMIELVVALAVVGVVILAMGVIPQLAKTDMLGFGLRGFSGLMIYLAFLAAVGGTIYGVYRATVRGAAWAAPIQKALMRVPQLGTALETFALARLSWAMSVTLGSGMDLRKALELSLASTENVLYTQHAGRVSRSVSAGNEVYESLDATHVFPPRFVDAVQVGEQSGLLPETMANLSAQYQSEARLAMQVITALLGFLVFALIAMMIIFLIYQIFTNAYLGPINDALKGL
jgi:type II secretory pathway component PulF